ncbi:MAG: adenine-specific methyltransferase EcoRI family protein [Patescibacteria group bacterium]
MEKKSSNSNLHRAAKVKNDEFYTRRTDIENELKHYKDQFRGKIVYCNCDDPFESDFFKYFAANFNALGLKKLITTSYVKSPIVGKQLPLFEMRGLKPDGKEPIKIEVSEVKDLNSDGAIGLEDVQRLLKDDANVTTSLKESGDFRSKECVELLKRADIVVTNPPFSLFREYIAQLMKNRKKFLIIGNDNAISYKEFFEFIKKNKIWAGYGKVKEFRQPDGTIKKFGNVGWYTNLDTTKRHDKLTLYKKYDRKEYVKYDNYNAIEVSKVSDIPMNYEGVMGVPVTFLDKYNPSQFEILGITDRDPNNKYRAKMYTKKDSPKYNDLNRRAAIKVNNELKPTYARLLIKLKQ